MVSNERENEAEQILTILDCSKDLFSARQRFCETAGRLIGMIERSEYSDETADEVLAVIHRIIERTHECKKQIAMLSGAKYIGIQLAKQDESEGRRAFNIDNINCYTPETVARFAALYEQKITDEENQKKEQQRKRDICDKFKLLVFEDEEKYQEQASILKAIQAEAKEESDYIREYDLFYQCVTESSVEKILNVVDENLDVLKSMFRPFDFSGIERSLYNHRIVVGEKKGNDDLPIQVDTDYGFHCAILRSPKSATWLVGNVKDSKPQPAFLKALHLVISTVLKISELSVDLMLSMFESKDNEIGAEMQNDLANAFEYLHRWGFLVKHSFSESVEGISFRPAYAVTAEAYDILSQHKCAEFFHIGRKHNSRPKYDASKITAVDFLRISICLCACSKIAGIVRPLVPSFDISRKTFPLLSFNNEDEVVVIFPVAAMDADSAAIDACVEFISEKISQSASGRKKLIALTLNEEKKAVGLQWLAVLSQKLAEKLHEDELELLCGTMNFDLFSRVKSNGDEIGELVSAEELLAAYCIPEQNAIAENEPDPDRDDDPSATTGQKSEISPVQIKPEEPDKSDPTLKDQDDTADASDNEETDNEKKTDAEPSFPECSDERLQNRIGENDDLKMAVEWMARGDLAESLVLLRAVEGMRVPAENNKDNLYLLFASVLGDPMLRHDLDADNQRELVYLFTRTGGKDAWGWLKYSYWLRRYTLDNDDINVYNEQPDETYNLPSEIGSDAEILLKTSYEFLKRNGRRIGTADIVPFSGETVEALQKYAASLAERVRNIAGGGGSRIRSTRDGLLSGRSQIGSAVARIASGDRSDGLKKECLTIVEGYKENNVLSEKKIAGKIDAEWEKNRYEDTASRSRPIPIDVKNTLCNRIRDALDLLQRWGSLNPRDEVGENSKDVKKCKESVGRICEWLSSRAVHENTLEEAVLQTMAYNMNILNEMYSSDEPKDFNADFYRHLSDGGYVITIGKGTSEEPFLPLFPKKDCEEEWNSIWLKNPDEPHLTDVGGCIKKQMQAKEGKR